MAPLRENGWRWVRGLVALLFACAIVGLAAAHAGRVVFDTSHTPPTHHIVGRAPGILLAACAALFALGVIFLGMWKRWDFEIAGWVLLFVLIVMFAAH